MYGTSAVHAGTYPFTRFKYMISLSDLARRYTDGPPEVVPYRAVI